jgi:crotonobetainyl-CoA:carnitine CoA-transferase CaiB-like acyl-CoA transferase
MGAEVIKVEEPERGDYIRSLPPYENGVSVAFEMLNRGKKSITLDLETKEGQKVLKRLVKKADVFLESFRPGTTKKLGCDFDSLRKSNPRIVYCSLTGFGQTGPYKDLPAHDINVLALSGFLSLNGSEPTVPSLQVGDLAGGMLAALTITTALFARKKSKAQYIDASIIDVMLSWLSIPVALQLGGHPRMLGGASPFYRLYRAGDSKLLALGAIESKFWEGVCKIVQRPDLLPDQYSPEPRRTEVTKAIESAFLTRAADEWFHIMSEHDLPCTPVLGLEETMKDPQALSRQMIIQKGQTGSRKLSYIGNPCKISGLGQLDLTPSPKLGQHSTEILHEIGYSDATIRRFAKAGIT